MDGVTVGSRSRATHCVLAAEVTLDSGVTLEPGCVLGSKVKIGAQTRLPSGTELTVAEDHNEDGVDQGKLHKFGGHYQWRVVEFKGSIRVR